jgi:hypothetical protein
MNVQQQARFLTGVKPIYRSQRRFFDKGVAAFYKDWR